MKPKPMLPLLLVLLLLTCGAVVVSLRPSLENQAGRGYAEAQYQLGKCYFYGIGLAQDDAQAVKWFQLAARQGHSKAQVALGIMFTRGVGVPLDYHKALALFRKGCDCGLAAAQNQMGMMYAQGKGVSQDLEQAAQWFKLAAEQRYHPAEQNLKLATGAKCSFFPQIVTRNFRTYRQVKIQKVEWDGITVSFQPRPGSVGVAKLEFKDLPKDLQQQYGYSPASGVQISSSAQLVAVIVQPL